MRWNTEACDLADDLGDPTARLHANDYRCLAALEAGDLATMRTARAIFESESERIGQPLNRWQIAYHRALQRMLEGDLDAAEQSATEALTLGTAAGFPDDAVTIYGGQLMTLRWMQGRLHEMVVAHRARRARQPRSSSIFRAALAFAKSFDDPAPRGASAPRRRGRQRLPDVRRRHLAGRPRALGRRRRRAAGIDPRRRSCINACCRGTTSSRPHTSRVHGSVAHYLGLLAHTLDRHDEADQWFGQALAFHEAMEAPFFVALTQTAWAELLADRDRPETRNGREPWSTPRYPSRRPRVRLRRTRRPLCSNGSNSPGTIVPERGLTGWCRTTKRCRARDL